MCHPHVAGDQASRPVITEVIMYLDELERMPTTDEEIPTPKFALQRVHDILFVFGSMSLYGDKSFECYSTRADRWTEVSCTQIHWNSALLRNCKCPLNSNLLSDCTQQYITVSAIRFDSTERFAPKFKFVDIIFHACELQSLVILLKNNVHNLYF
jgi:hypothetical protein